MIKIITLTMLISSVAMAHHDENNAIKFVTDSDNVGIITTI